MLTDFYQLSMAYAYWKSGLQKKEGVFHLFFRKAPFNGGYTIACGLQAVIDFLNDFSYSQDDIDYLASLKDRDGSPMFEEEFLKYLLALEFTCDVDAIPEGTVVFPHQPLLRVKGPLIQCQLIETPLLNLTNFPTLIATKAARIVHAAEGDPVLEFGLRRAQGIDGALTASRAAYIGGCASTSNVLAGKVFGIPIGGTHSHSWVMSFENEQEAFEAYAEAMPNNCVFLVDTYDTIEGVKEAIKMGEKLRKNGSEMIGIRIDSGDLSYFSKRARKLLDKAGFPKAAIVASNDLDENLITSLKLQDAKINVWGVGTKLATAYDQPALGAVYKLSAIINEDGKYQHKIKLSEQSLKVNNPGIQQVTRLKKGEEFKGDFIYDELNPPTDKLTFYDPLDQTRRTTVDLSAYEVENLLVPIFSLGKLCYDAPNIKDIRMKVKRQLAGFDAGVKRFLNPHNYKVGLEEELFKLKNQLILKLRKHI